MSIKKMKHSITFTLMVLIGLILLCNVTFAASDTDRAMQDRLAALVRQEGDRVIQHKLDPQSETLVMEPIIKAVMVASNLIREYYSKKMEDEIRLKCREKDVGLAATRSSKNGVKPSQSPPESQSQSQSQSSSAWSLPFSSQLSNSLPSWFSSSPESSASGTQGAPLLPSKGQGAPLSSSKGQGALPTYVPLSLKSQRRAEKKAKKMEQASASHANLPNSAAMMQPPTLRGSPSFPPSSSSDLRGISSPFGILSPELVASMMNDPNGIKFLNDLQALNRFDSRANRGKLPNASQGNVDRPSHSDGSPTSPRCDKLASEPMMRGSGPPNTLGQRGLPESAMRSPMHAHPFSPNAKADKGRRGANLADSPYSIPLSQSQHPMSGPMTGQRVIAAAPGSRVGPDMHGLLPLAPAPLERGPYSPGNIDGEGDCETDTCPGSPNYPTQPMVAAGMPITPSSDAWQANSKAQSQLQNLLAFSGDPKARPSLNKVARKAGQGQLMPSTLSELSLNHPEPLLRLFSSSLLSNQAPGGLGQSAPHGSPAEQPRSGSLHSLSAQSKVPLDPSEWQQAVRNIPNGKAIKLNWRARRPTEIGNPMTPDGFTCQGDPHNPYEVYVGSEKHRQKCRFLSMATATTILSRFPEIYYLDRKDNAQEGVLADFTNNYVIGHHELMPFDPVTIDFEGDMNSLCANVHGAKYVWQSGLAGYLYLFKLKSFRLSFEPPFGEPPFKLRKDPSFGVVFEGGPEIVLPNLAKSRVLKSPFLLNPSTNRVTAEYLLAPGKQCEFLVTPATVQLLQQMKLNGAIHFVESGQAERLPSPTLSPPTQPLASSNPLASLASAFGFLQDQQGVRS